MVNLTYLKPFTFYRLKTPVIMPENANNRKKGVLYSVLAPSIKDEFNFLSTTNILAFRNLYKYFVDKAAVYTFYGSGQKKVYFNKEGDITDILLKAQKHKTFKNVDEVTSFLKTVKSNTIKGFNLLYEINGLSELVLTNEHDKRILMAKAAETVKAITTGIKSRFDYTGNQFDSTQYPEQWLIIPMNLWLDSSEYTTPFTRTSKSIMGQMIHAFSEDPNKFKSLVDSYTKVLLVSDNNLMIIDYGNIPEKSKPSYVIDRLKFFLKKCKSAEIVEDIFAEDITDDTDNAGLTSASVQTKKELEVEKILVKSKIDPDTVPEVKKVQLAASIEVKPKEDNEPKERDVVTLADDIIDDVDVDLDLSNMPAIKDTDDIDIIVQAKTAGQSIENYKRNQMLKDKYKTLSIGDRPIEEVIKDEEKYDVPDLSIKINTPNKALKNIKSYKFENSYNKNLSQYDLANILMHFSHCKPALYINKDITVEDISTTIDKLYKYTVEFEDENRKRHRFSFKMPKMYEDRYLFLNEQKFNIIHQKVPFPVTKTDSNMCQVATNYNKIRMSRYGSNISAKITKLTKVLMGEDYKSAVMATRGNCTKLNAPFLTTIELDELASKFAGLKTKDYVFTLDLTINNNDTSSYKKPAVDNPDSLSIVGFYKKSSPIWLDGMTNKVYIGESEEPKGELSDVIISAISEGNDKFLDEFNDISAGTKFVYTRAKVLELQVPIILVLSCADPGGLLGVLEKAKINYEFTSKRPTVDKDNQGVVAFADGWLVFDRYPYENSLLLNGLSAFPTKEFNYFDMGTRDTYVEIFDMMFSRRNLVDGIENFYNLLIDPITLDILRKVGMPDTFTELMLYANGLLADNSYHIDSDYHDSRLRSNEIVNVYLYRELCSSYAQYKDGRAEKFAIPEDAVIKDLVSSNIVDSHSKLNVTLEVENDRQVKLKGPGGMNEDRSFTLEKRAYHPTMRGIIGMNSTPSGEVGINRHMTLNCNLLDSRGFVELNKPEYDGMEMITPGEALQTFGPESADIERVAMAISQSKHVVPTAEAGPSLITYDMERVIPYISNDFSFVAKADGKVLEIANGIMIVKYKDGSVDDIDLSEHPDKNTDGGFHIMNYLTPKFKVGQSFKENDILAYDPKYIGTKDMFGDLTANVGTLSTVAIECNGNVFEDSCYITDELAHRLATKLTQEKNVIISRFANIKYVAKKGQAVKANDPLLTFDDTEDEFASQLLAGMAEEADDTDEVIATTAPVITKVTGIVKDIKVYYTVPLEDVTPSLRKLIESLNKENIAREKFISKYKDVRDANTILTPARQVIPDSTGRVKGVKVGEGVLIEFYIEYEDVMGVGDKLTNFTALKGIVNGVIPKGYEAYGEFDEDDKIDAFLSANGVYKRMTLDIVKVGALTKILVGRKKQMAKKYGERVKAELKKR